MTKTDSNSFDFSHEACSQFPNGCFVVCFFFKYINKPRFGGIKLLVLKATAGEKQ